MRTEIEPLSFLSAMFSLCSGWEGHTNHTSVPLQPFLTYSEFRQPAASSSLCQGFQQLPRVQSHLHQPGLALKKMEARISSSKSSLALPKPWEMLSGWAEDSFLTPVFQGAACWILRLSKAQLACVNCYSTTCWFKPPTLPVSSGVYSPTAFCYDPGVLFLIFCQLPWVLSVLGNTTVIVAVYHIENPLLLLFHPPGRF